MISYFGGSNNIFADFSVDKKIIVAPKMQNDYKYDTVNLFIF